MAEARQSAIEPATKLDVGKPVEQQPGPSRLHRLPDKLSREADIRILVTGGAGFNGSHLTHAQVDRDDEVVVLDTLETGHRAAIPDEAHFMVASVADTGLTGMLLTETRRQAIVHLAGSSVVPDSCIQLSLARPRSQRFGGGARGGAADALKTTSMESALADTATRATLCIGPTGPDLASAIALYRDALPPGGPRLFEIGGLDQIGMAVQVVAYRGDNGFLMESFGYGASAAEATVGALAQNLHAHPARAHRADRPSGIP